jgi:hypothetical protein
MSTCLLIDVKRPVNAFGKICRIKILGNITIKQVKLGLNLAAKTLNYVSINGSITFAGMTLDIYTLLPDFQMGGGLAKGSKISFKSIIQNFFSVSDNFPEIAITQFSM